MVNDHGLHVPSGHFNYDGLEGKFDYAAELGLEYMICPMLPEKGWLELDTYKKAAEQFNKWANKPASAECTSVHNHNYEFHRFTDKAGKTTTGYDVLMSNTDANLVWAEMDCYWMTQAGQDPLKMFNRLGKRIRMLHLQRSPGRFPAIAGTQRRRQTLHTCGTGTIDWKKIVAVAEKNDIRHMFVEQDSGGIPLENIATSLRTSKLSFSALN